MMRQLLKQGMCGALARTGLDRRLGRAVHRHRRAWVVGYHQVVADDAALETTMPGMAITAGTFERHLGWMREHFRMVSLGEAEALLESDAPLKQPLAAITFDDGYRGVHDVALPVLRRMGIPASVFVVTDLVGTSRLLLHDRIFLALRKVLGSRTRAHRTTRELLLGRPRAELEELAQAFEDQEGPPAVELALFQPLTWEMLSALQAAGFTIGSHTRTHSILTRSGARPDAEIAGSRQDLERRLGTPVRHFAYPDGQFDRVAVSAVAGAGYRFAYTTCAHRDELFPDLTVPRTMLWEQSSIDSAGRFSPAVMSCQAEGLVELVAGCRRHHARA